MDKQLINSKLIIGVLFILMIPFIAMLVFAFNTKGLTGFSELSLPVRFNEISCICFRSLIVSCIASLFAYLISYLLVIYTNSRFQNLFLIFITLPFLANEAVRVFAWQNILAENGLFNQILSLVFQKPILLFNSSNGLNIYITMILACIPFAIFICTGTLKILPEIYWKVSNDLKLSPINKFLKVGLPLTKYSLLASVLVTFFISFALSSEVNFLGGATKISTRGFILSLMSANRYEAIFAFGTIILVLISFLFFSVFFYTKFKRVN